MFKLSKAVNIQLGTKKFARSQKLQLNAFEKLNTIQSQLKAFKIHGIIQAILIVVSSLLLGS